jgi:hypothetical protein
MQELALARALRQVVWMKGGSFIEKVVYFIANYYICWLHVSYRWHDIFLKTSPMGDTNGLKTSICVYADKKHSPAASEENVNQICRASVCVCLVCMQTSLSSFNEERTHVLVIPSHTNRIFLLSLLPNNRRMRTCGYFYISVPNAKRYKLCPKCVVPLEMTL